MSKMVPAAIRFRLDKLDAALAEMRALQQRDGQRYQHLINAATRYAATLDSRRARLKELRAERRHLIFAVDAIEGRIIDIGMVEAPEEVETRPFTPSKVGTKPFVAPIGRVKDSNTRQSRMVRETAAANSNNGETKKKKPKDLVFETIVQFARPVSPAEILAQLPRDALNSPAGLGALLGRLSQQGKITKIERGRNDNLWQAAAT